MICIFIKQVAPLVDEPVLFVTISARFSVLYHDHISLIVTVDLTHDVMFVKRSVFGSWRGFNRRLDLRLYRFIP